MALVIEAADHHSTVTLTAISSGVEIEVYRVFCLPDDIEDQVSAVAYLTPEEMRRLVRWLAPKAGLRLTD